MGTCKESFQVSTDLNNTDKILIIGYLKDLAEGEKSPLFKYQVECVIDRIEEDLV